MGEKVKIISVIKKLLAKTENNNNEFEVQSALLKAQEMMVKYGLELKDIKDHDTTQKKEVVRDNITDTEKLLWWVWKLGDVIGENFRCDCLKRKSKGKSTLSFLGLQEDVAIAKELFEFARESLDYFATAYIVKMCDEINLTPIYKRPPEKQRFFTLKDFTDNKNDYIKGFISGLDTKFKEQVKKNGWGLILVKDNAVIEAMSKIKIRQVSIPSGDKGSGNATHYGAGFKDGYSMEYRNDLLTN